MKLLHVENSSGRGGSLKSLAALWPAPKQWEVEVVSLERLWSDGIECDVPVTVFPKQSVYKAWRLLQEKNIDVLHINNAMVESWCFIVAAWWEGIPVISHFRSNRPLRKIEYFLTHLCKKILLLSKVHQKILPVFMPSMILYNGIADKGKGEEPQVLKIGVFSVLKDGKGHEDVIRALVKIDLEWQLHIVGGAVSDQKSTKPHLEALAKKYKVTDKIFFHGHLQEPETIMQDCLIVCDPSHKTEGFRRTLGEAAMMSRLVLATAVGGASDLLDEDELIPVGDIESWKNAFEKHLNNTKHCRLRGEALRTKALEMFNRQNTYNNFWKLIKELTGAKDVI